MGQRQALGRIRRLIEDGPGDDGLDGWKAAASSALLEAFHEDHPYATSFAKVRYNLGFWTDRTPASAFQQAQQAGITTATGILRSAARELEEDLEDVRDPVDFDPGLWANVAGLVEADDWAKVASQAAIYLENALRLYAGLPAGTVGQTLMLAVFKPKDGVFPCGSTPGEQEGWQQLATGFAKAISNVDRHHIQDRDDLRTYAMGVLGTASLLLTQLRYEHGVGG